MKFKTVVSGALLTLLSYTVVHAASDVDILLNLLVNKGVITEQEIGLVAENDQFVVVVHSGQELYYLNLDSKILKIQII